MPSPSRGWPARTARSPPALRAARVDRRLVLPSARHGYVICLLRSFPTISAARWLPQTLSVPRKAEHAGNPQKRCGTFCRAYSINLRIAASLLFPLLLVNDVEAASGGGNALAPHMMHGRYSPSCFTIFSLTLRFKGHRYFTFTFTVFVVSLPRMSITFTTTVYSPGSA